MKHSITLIRPRCILQWLRLYGLYLSAFPAAERKPFAVIRKMAKSGRADLWYLETDGRFAGLAATVNSGELILLDYFAVVKAQRGKGVGTEALKLLLETYAGKGVFVEIESTREAAPNREERQKRKRFYCRCGMEPLGVTAEIFGVTMELLGRSCQLDFEGYRAFYRDHYSPWAAEHIRTAP